MNVPLSVIVITKNEEHNIGACLESVRWADEIVLVDAESTDQTAEIAQSYNAKVFIRAWEGFSQSKQFALEQTTHRWIFWIDADERVTPELAGEIKKCIEKNPDDVSGYRIARRAYFLGQWIKHCGWYPGYVVRLFKKDSVRFTDHDVHEQLDIQGRIETLHHDVLHFTDNSLEHYFNKYNSYTSLAANQMFESGKNVSLSDLLLRPGFLFIKMYFLKLGFLDGMRGFILCRLSASYVFTKYAKLWEAQQKKLSK